MSSELYDAINLGDLINYKKGIAFKSKDYSDNGIPLIRVSNFHEDTLSPNDLKFLPRKIAEENKSVELKFSDIVVATVGSWPNNPSSVVGRVISVPKWSAGALMNQNSVILTAKDSDFYNQRYLFYCLKTKDFSNHIISKAQGSANQASITLDAIFSFPIFWSDYSHRQSVASFLTNIDDRITLLRETNTTLEAIAQALFKSWFVDFDPVHAKQQGRAPEGMDAQTAALFPDSFEESELGMVPKGWEVKPIGDLVPTVGGATPDTKNENFWSPAEFHWSSPKDLSGATSPVLLDTEKKISAAGLKKISSGLLPEGTLLMSSRAPIGYLAIAAVPVAINQGYIAIPSGGMLSPLYMLYWCKANMETIKGNANGSTFMEISKKAFRPILAVKPESKVLKAFEAIASGLFERLKSNEQQAQTLAGLRDTLLPRLISGQLRLPEAQAQLESVDV